MYAERPAAGNVGRVVVAGGLAWSPPDGSLDMDTQPDVTAPLRCSAALTHHWLVRLRGGEKVLEACAELLPDAPVYTLVCDRRGIAGSPLAQRDIHASCLQWLPGATRHYPKLLPLLPWAARRMKLPPAELVLCSDAAVAKAMTSDARSKVVCYCHSPMRYAFEEEISREYARALPRPLRPLWPGLCRRLRDADRRAAERVDVFVANSRHVAQRIKRCYGRDATVVHPPVDVPPLPAKEASEPIHTGRVPVPHREDFHLCVGYHVPYKRLDLAVEACRRLGRKLVVIGDGPDVARLRRMYAERAGGTAVSAVMSSDATPVPPVTWLGWQPPAVINDHYARAAALLFPGEEDFGIVPVEAMAHGCPVIAYGVGGATESVVDGQTGVLFSAQTVECLIAAIRLCAQIAFDPQTMHRHALRFDKPRFLREMRAVLTGVLGTR